MDTKKRNENGLTERQERFLSAYSELLDVYKAAKVAGIARSNIMADLKRDTPFSHEFSRMCAKIDDDPRLTKSGSIGRMLDMMDELDDMAQEAKDVGEKLAILKQRLDIQKEINKMQDGHLASQKKVIQNNTLTISGTYDFTKKGLPEREEPTTLDISHEELES